MELVQRFAAAALAEWVEAVFRACGVARVDAVTAAHILVRTSLRGIDTHGIARVPTYADKLRCGELNPRAQPRLEIRNEVLHCFGDGGLGQVVATSAARRAIEIAQDRAVVSCAIHGSGHLGALGLFALQAGERGLVALLCQRTPPIMALPGSRGRAIGNNPIAFCAPIEGRPPLVFDMATSVVARGHVLQAVRERQATIPEGWAIGPDGASATDPAAALKGAMLPVAGHKGVGLAMLVECLTSLGGSFGDQGEAARNEGSAGNASAFLIVVNPDLFCGRAAFDAQMQMWLHTYLQASGPHARYPGQRQAACERRRLEAGIPIPAALLAEIRNAGEQVGATFNLTPMRQAQ